jgi:hypothetical protein
MNDDYALDPERYIAEQNYKLIGDLSCNRMTDLLRETEDLLKSTKKGIEDLESNEDNEQVNEQKKKIVN